VAVLGIAITVVSIVVQLAATRYTPRIADMFFRDRTNLAIIGFFVVACLNAVWVTLSVSSNYVPRITIRDDPADDQRQPPCSSFPTSPTCSTSSTPAR